MRIGPAGNSAIIFHVLAIIAVSKLVEKPKFILASWDISIFQAKYTRLKIHIKSRNFQQF